MTPHSMRMAAGSRSDRTHPDGAALLTVGDKENAMIWLVRGYEEHNFMLPFINVDPAFDSLRDNPRFQEILREMGLRS